MMDRADEESSAAACSRSIPSGDTEEVNTACDEAELLVHIDQSSSTIRRHKSLSKNDNDSSNNNSSSNDCDNSKDSHWRSHVTLTHRVIDWIQRIEIPAAATSSTSSKQGNRVPLISGLDHVVYGTSAAADVVLIAGYKPPRYCFYMLSGSLCDVLQFGVDAALHTTRIIVDDSLCWAMGFFISILFRHTSHRYLVFGNHVGGYYKSLCRMYAAYSIIIVLSTLFNMLMTKVASFSHTVAWFLTLLWTGIANYFILKKVWTFGGAV